MTRRLERVEWLDSGVRSKDGWQSVDELVDDLKLARMTCVTVGILIHEDDDVILLAGSHDVAADSFLNVQGVAKQNVLQRQVLGLEP